MDQVVVSDEVKKEIRSILLSKVGGVRLSDFQKDFSRYIGHPLNLKKMNLSRLTDLIDLIPDVAVIERSEKDGQNYIHGVKDPNMFMNRTACKAQYKPRPGSQASRKTMAPLEDVDMNSELVKQWCKKLVPNRQDLYAVGCVKNNMTREDIDKIFSAFGVIVEVGFSSKYAFIRYRQKEEALHALSVLHKSGMDLIIPDEKNATKKDGKRRPEGGPQHKTATKKTTWTFNSIKSPDAAPPSSGHRRGAKTDNEVSNPGTASSEDHKIQGDDLVDMFVGNVPFSTSEDDLITLFENFNIVEVKLRGNDVKRFAFVRLPAAETSKLVEKFHKKKHGRFDLIVATAKNSRAKSDSSQSPPSNGLPRFEWTSCKTRSDHHVLPLLDLKSEHSLPDLEGDHLLPDFENDAALPGLEYACNDYGGQGNYPHYHSNQHSRSETIETFDLFVSNFPFGTTDMDLFGLFTDFGPVYIDMKNSTNYERATWALIAFSSEEERDNAFMSAFNTYYNNRLLVVNIAYSSYTPEEEYEMRVQPQQEMRPDDDFDENFLVTVTNAEAAAHRCVQKVNLPGKTTSQHSSFNQKAPLLVKMSSSSNPPSFKATDADICNQMAALSMHHMSNGMAPTSEPPPLEQYW